MKSEIRKVLEKEGSVTMEEIQMIDESEEMKYIKSMSRVELEMLALNLFNELYRSEEQCNMLRGTLTRTNNSYMQLMTSRGGVTVPR